MEPVGVILSALDPFCAGPADTRARVALGPSARQSPFPSELRSRGDRDIVPRCTLLAPGLLGDVRA
jgi:hypothetical protein